VGAAFEDAEDRDDKRGKEIDHGVRKHDGGEFGFGAFFLGRNGGGADFLAGGLN